MLASHFLRCYFGKENAFLADRVGTISTVMSCASKLWITAFPTQTESSNHIISLFGAEVAIFHVFVLSLHGFKLPSIASLPFETVLVHIDGGREWCLQPTNNNNSLRILDRKLFLGFHDKLYVETAIWSVFIFVFPIYNSFPLMIY